MPPYLDFQRFDCSATPCLRAEAPASRSLRIDLFFALAFH